MPKFLHTADWHIGLRAKHAGDKGDALRSARFDSVRQLLALARDEQVDFILIAGDLFDKPDIEEQTIRDLVELLNGASAPVYVIPGNHDPYVPISAWETEAWKSTNQQVRLLTIAEPVSVSEQTIIYPCPIFQKTSILDPTAWIPAREPEDRRVRIGFAHGSLQILNEQTPMDFPIPMDRQVRSGLDYLALGDWHGTRIINATAYPGTHEQTSFADRDSGNVLIVDIPSAGASPLIRTERVGRCTWKKLDCVIQDQTDVSALRSEIDELGSIDSLCLQISVLFGGQVSAETVEALEALREDLGKALWLQWKGDSTAGTDSIEVIPDGVLREVFRHVNSPDEHNLEPEAASEARQWLLQFAARISR